MIYRSQLKSRSMPDSGQIGLMRIILLIHPITCDKMKFLQFEVIVTPLLQP
jgi:hypothetical protein